MDSHLTYFAASTVSFNNTFTRLRSKMNCPHCQEILDSVPIPDDAAKKKGLALAVKVIEAMNDLLDIYARYDGPLYLKISTLTTVDPSCSESAYVPSAAILLMGASQLSNPLMLRFLRNASKLVRDARNLEVIWQGSVEIAGNFIHGWITPPHGLAEVDAVLRSLAIGHLNSAPIENLDDILERSLAHLSFYERQKALPNSHQIQCQRAQIESIIKLIINSKRPATWTQHVLATNVDVSGFHPLVTGGSIAIMGAAAAGVAAIGGTTDMDYYSIFKEGPQISKVIRLEEPIRRADKLSLFMCSGFYDGRFVSTTLLMDHVYELISRKLSAGTEDRVYRRCDNVSVNWIKWYVERWPDLPHVQRTSCKVLSEISTIPRIATKMNLEERCTTICAAGALPMGELMALKREEFLRAYEKINNISCDLVEKAIGASAFAATLASAENTEDYGLRLMVCAVTGFLTHNLEIVLQHGNLVTAVCDGVVTLRCHCNIRDGEHALHSSCDSNFRLTKKAESVLEQLARYRGLRWDAMGEQGSQLPEPGPGHVAELRYNSIEHRLSKLVGSLSTDLK